MPGVTGVTVVTMLVCFLILHARLRAHRAPGIPCALCSFGANWLIETRAHARRDGEGVSEISAVVIASAAKQAIFDLATLRRGLLRFARNDGKKCRRAWLAEIAIRARTKGPVPSPRLRSEPLTQQHCVRAVYGFGAIHHRAFKRGR